MTDPTDPTDPQPPDSTPEPAARPAGPVPESRSDRAGRHLHRARLYTGAFAFVGLIVVLIVLISVNTRTVKLSWAFGSTRASLVWIILATAVIGWLLGIATGFAFRRRTRRRVPRAR
jgi:uncharacterized integral membrane protein